MFLFKQPSLHLTGYIYIPHTHTHTLSLSRRTTPLTHTHTHTLSILLSILSLCPSIQHEKISHSCTLFFDIGGGIAVIKAGYVFDGGQPGLPFFFTSTRNTVFNNRALGTNFEILGFDYSEYLCEIRSQ